ncbi:MAG: membrane protein insertase YidC [Polyangiaceae bacterium]|nr:membrane protein insertase YidC [Myxococcales bacterium]MCB9589387.1 membrane protein insertase YidC [Polyangiaceae bacterium]
MERGGASRLLLMIAMGLLTYFAFTKCNGEKKHEPQPLGREFRDAPKTRVEAKTCDLWTPQFRASFSTHGASLTRYELLTAKYRKHDHGLDLATAQYEFRRSLRFHWRQASAHDLGGPPWQFDVDTVDWTIVKNDGKTCEFSYEADGVKLTKTLATTDRPYEIQATGRIENTAKDARRHALTIETTEWRTEAEVKGHMFRQSPFVTHVECIDQGEKATRLHESDFEPSDFEDPPFQKNPLNDGDWYQVAGEPAVAAVSNYYFSHAIAPTNSAQKPVCQLQIEEWPADADHEKGAMYRARLAYPVTNLDPGKSAEYSVLSYIGPKDSALLAAAGGGNHKFSELPDLGFFAVIAKLLVAFLFKVHSVIPNWGVAIIILTITARVLLFPLNVPMIKNSLKMRELKPEMDALNEKYKDDAQAKGLAQMELWRKHNVNPFKGCLPQMASMPVWFALYTTLQHAVELYNIKFLWFPDLTEPDPYFILPFIIGAVFFVQQKVAPQQATDPAQQKMMLYFMPAMFTVFMLFLPAGLGVYMFTNSLLGIAQQQIIERRAKRKVADAQGTMPNVPNDAKTSEKSEKKIQEPSLFGKGKA